MKIAYGLALAALAFACSSSSKSTRSAGNDTGTTQSGSISGTTPTAPSSGSVATAGQDTSTPGTMGTLGGSTTAQGTTGTLGGDNSSTAGAAAPPSSAGTSDTSNLRTVTGAVAKVDENSITLDQSAGGVTLTVDSQTQVIRRGKPAAGISSIREGEQVRASIDPASNRAEKIELMGRMSGKMK